MLLRSVCTIFAQQTELFWREHDTIIDSGGCASAIYQVCGDFSGYP